MREITVNSVNYLLLDDLPSFRNGVKLEILSLDDVVDGITRVEERSSLAGFKVKASQQIEIRGATQVAAVKSYLANLEDGKVAMPLWGLAQDGGAGIYQEPAVTPARAVYFTNWGRNYVVHSAWDAFGIPNPGELKVPLVFGRIQKIRTRTETSRNLILQIDFIEDADPSLGLSYSGDGSEFPAGITTSKGIQKLMPFSPDWGTQESGGKTVEIISQELGFRRESAVSYYSQLPTMPLGFTHYFQGSHEAAELIAFFMHHQGRVKGFWTPTWTPGMHPAGNVAAGTEEIILDVDFSSSLLEGDEVAIINSRDQIQINTLAEPIANSGGKARLILNEPVAFDLNGSTVVCPAAYARFKSPRLSIRFGANGQASCGVNLVTMPVEQEAALPTGESVDTYGDQGTKVFCYRFAERDPEDGNLVPDADFVADPAGVAAVTLNGASSWANDIGRNGFAGIELNPAASVDLTMAESLPAAAQVEVEVVGKNYPGTILTQMELWDDTQKIRDFTIQGTAWNRIRMSGTLSSASDYLRIRNGSGRCYLDSVIIRKLPVNTWTFTSFETSLVDADDDQCTWASQPIEHSSVQQVLNMEASSLDLKSRAFDGNPLGIFSNFDIQHDLEAEVLEGILDAEGKFKSKRVIFLGKVTTVDFDGPFIRAKAKSVGTLFDRKVPAMMVQKTCNWALFSSPCGLAKAAWKKSGTMDVASGESVITCIFGEALPAGWLRGGWIEITTASRVIRMTIINNTATTDLGGGSFQCDLALGQPVTAAQDAAVAAFPGCDGHHTTCQDKFSNYSNFGGFPFIPANNPTMLKVSKNATQGGKK